MSISIDLSGQVAVVTGGGSGIGEAIARTLARAGAAVAVADLSADAAGRVAKEIDADGGKALAVAVDLGDRAGLEAAFAQIRAELGPVDHLVNNAAAWAIKTFADHTAADIEKVVGVTLLGTINATQVALPDIVARGGSVVMVASDSARVGEAWMSVYAGAKAGLIGFAKSIAKEVGRSGARVNVVAPGTTETPGSAGFIEAAGGAEKLARAYPLGRLGKPEDIANATLFLVSPLSSWMTGQVLSVSGGFTMV
ncbi:MAG: SDR family NAD(P)-dependent oxidoreductase [Sporichthyaceae bacterium]